MLKQYILPSLDGTTPYINRVMNTIEANLTKTPNNRKQIINWHLEISNKRSDTPPYIFNEKQIFSQLISNKRINVMVQFGTTTHRLKKIFSKMSQIDFKKTVYL